MFIRRLVSGNPRAARVKYGDRHRGPRQLVGEMLSATERDRSIHAAQIQVLNGSSVRGRGDRFARELYVNRKAHVRPCRTDQKQERERDRHVSDGGLGDEGHSIAFVVPAHRVAHPTNRVYEARFGAAVDLGAHVGDVAVHSAELDIAVRAPHLVEELFAR